MARGEVLIVHHVEAMWEGCFDEEYLLRVATHLRRANYDKVLYLTMEGDDGDRQIRLSENADLGWCWRVFAEALRRHDPVCECWTYSWEETPEVAAEMVNLPVEDFITFPWGHGIAYLYPYLKALVGRRVVVFGGCVDECLADLRASLIHLGVKHRTIRALNF